MKKLPLHEWHVAHGGKMGEFAGHEMPLYYSKPLEEHQQVRSRGGLFDITHMGQFQLTGEKAGDMLAHALPNDVLGMTDGQALYSPLCKPDGGVLDDLIIYRQGKDRFFIIVNGDTLEKDLAWLTGLAGMFNCQLDNLTPQRCLFAVQGPQVFSLLAPHLGVNPASLGYFRFAETTLFGQLVFLARTGYTGEPGVEISLNRDGAQQVWESMATTLTLPPIGLVARDTLRLEAALPLYGHELDESHTPWESGIGWTVKLGKTPPFIGQESLTEQLAKGALEQLAGLEIMGRGIPRAGYPVLASGKPVGVVTSGGHAPTLDKPIALARISAEWAAVGQEVQVEIRGKPVEARVVRLPFYKNPAIRK
ncbi:MAG: glycine cleavage system aminomethyltransferase GcvT [Deltaproteobacteria bacterium]|nr:glycine cleavage system aminomethyltransferase GcvT [Deltaproteobacteria bacterium]